jgi:peptidoglycan/xylan/chitin deacetylase (PgdA/CDA1 family)
MQPVSLLFHDVFVSDLAESGFSSLAADRYKLSVPEFEQQIEGLQAARITFDDGGVSYYTVVADALEARGMRAHCFVSTAYIGRAGFLDKAQIRELDARGHLIGTHSVSHPTRFSVLSRDEMRREWSESRRALEDIVGHAVTTGSVPGGYFSRAVARAATDAGLHLLFNSEPVRSSRQIEGCVVAGRFAIRRGAPPDFSRQLVHSSPWARYREWAAWNAKGLVKPLLGSSYPRVVDWIYGGAR